MVKEQKQQMSQEDMNRQREEGRQRDSERKASESRRRKEAEEAKRVNRQKAINVQKKRSQKSWINEYGLYVLVAAGVLAFMIFLRMEPNTAENLDSAEAPVIEEMYISEHNEGDASYNLGSNTIFDGVNLAESRKMFKNYFNQQVLFPRCAAKTSKEALPENFNWQDVNPGCVKRVQNQELCSSSWAMATLSAFTDRFCAKSGDQAYRASVQHVLTCEKKTSKGCDAGYLIGALEYGRTRGYVHADCMPYKPYDIAVDCNMAEINKCFQKEKVKDYCSVTGTEDIKREIMENGPVVSLFPAYRDFLIYKDGVFNPTGDAARVDGHQAVKIIGWNTSGKTPYWIAENTFGLEWGESGIVKIAMKVHDSSLDKTAIAVNVDYTEESAE